MDESRTGGEEEEEREAERGSRNPQMGSEIKGDGETTGTEGREET